jgi:hypothetical protein
MINFKITIQAGESNGVMSLTIDDVRKNNYPVETLVEGTNIISFDVSVPNKLIFTISGKDNKKDTVLDKGTGEIIKDKFVKVGGLDIDGKPLNKHRVAQMFVLKTVDGDEIKSAFWGFNGTVELDLPYEDALDFHLSNLG